MWPLFRDKIDVIRDHIKDLEKVMASHVTLEHVLQSHRESRRAIYEAEKAEEARNRQYWKEMETEVSPRLYDDRLDKIVSESCDDSGLWLEKRPQFRNWRDAAARSRCLWLSGIPGAGKSSSISTPPCASTFFYYSGVLPL